MILMVISIGNSISQTNALVKEDTWYKKTEAGWQYVASDKYMY